MTDVALAPDLPRCYLVSLSTVEMYIRAVCILLPRVNLCPKIKSPTIRDFLESPGWRRVWRAAGAQAADRGRERRGVSLSNCFDRTPEYETLFRDH